MLGEGRLGFRPPCQYSAVTPLPVRKAPAGSRLETSTTAVGDLEAGVGQHLRRGLGLLRPKVGQDDVLARADPSGDSLPDRTAPMTTTTSGIVGPPDLRRKGLVRRGVCVVGHGLQPGCGRTARGGDEHRQVGHQVVAGGAVPVLLTGRSPDRLAGLQHQHLAVPGRDEPDPVGAVQRLAEGVGVPVRPGARGEPNVGDDQLGLVRAVADAVDLRACDELI